jgi:hypothetical protein
METVREKGWGRDRAVIGKGRKKVRRALDGRWRWVRPQGEGLKRWEEQEKAELAESVEGGRRSDNQK